jgi:hypothetical protein
MFDWTDDQMFQRMPRSCRRALASFTGPDRGSAMRNAWDHCKDAVALLWLAALRAPHVDGGARKVLEEVERAKARVLEEINDPTTYPGRRAEERLVAHLDQPLAVVDGRPSLSDKLPDWDKELEEPMAREHWIEYVRRMDDVVEGIRINLRVVVVD